MSRPHKFPDLPKTRGDCRDGLRPCPYVRCYYHLWSFTRAKPLPHESCILDVADHGGATLEEVGKLMGITRERVRQIEYLALIRLRHRSFCIDMLTK